MRIVTSRDLIQHHHARAALYATFAAWSEGRPAVEEVHARARGLLPAGASAAGAAALLSAQAVSGTTQALRVLAFLTDQAAQALGDEDLAGAAALLGAERAYREQHGARVLRQTCARLAVAEEPAARALAASLAAVLDDDGVSPGAGGSPNRNVSRA